jgi:hypothetical protein
MARELSKKEVKILMDKWIADDKTLRINERVFILDKLMRRVIKKIGAEALPQKE